MDWSKALSACGGRSWWHHLMEKLAPFICVSQFTPAFIHSTVRRKAVVLHWGCAYRAPGQLCKEVVMPRLHPGLLSQNLLEMTPQAYVFLHIFLGVSDVYIAVEKPPVVDLRFEVWSPISLLVSYMTVDAWLNLSELQISLLWSGLKEIYVGSSHCGSVGNLTSVLGDVGSIPSLTQWVKDPVLPWAMV